MFPVISETVEPVELSKGGENVEHDLATPSCLAELTRHQSGVNIVRWSPDGRLLASGDTESAIMLWHYQPDENRQRPDLFGDQLGQPSSDGPVENWVVMRILRGHLQSQNAKKSCVSTVLGGDMHKGWINGVAWDPRGRFIVTLASDRCMRVFNGQTLKVVNKVYKCPVQVNRLKPWVQLKSGPNDAANSQPTSTTLRLFHDDTFKSFYRRLDFSPDGQVGGYAFTLGDWIYRKVRPELLIVPSGVLDLAEGPGMQYCTYLFTRANLSKPALVLPCDEYSISCRFSPVQFELRDSSEPSLIGMEYRWIYGVATQSSLILYDTQQAAPFALISKIHYISLNDLTWSPDGSMCVVSSTDGFCSFIQFEEGELGVKTGHKVVTKKEEIASEEALDNKKEEQESEIKPEKCANQVQHPNKISSVIDDDDDEDED